MGLRQPPTIPRSISMILGSPQSRPKNHLPPKSQKVILEQSSSTEGTPSGMPQTQAEGHAFRPATNPIGRARLQACHKQTHPQAPLLSGVPQPHRGTSTKDHVLQPSTLPKSRLQSPTPGSPCLAPETWVSPLSLIQTPRHQPSGGKRCQGVGVSSRLLSLTF